MAATNGSFAKGPDSRRFGGGRSPTPRVLAPDGTKKTLAEIAREGTWDAVQVLRECVNDDGEQMSTRIRAAGYLLSLGWGDAPKALQVTAITDSRRVQELTEQDLLALLRQDHAIDLQPVGESKGGVPDAPI